MKRIKIKIMKYIKQNNNNKKHETKPKILKK